MSALPILLQPRVHALLRGLFLITRHVRHQIATLFFDCKREYAKRRLQKLKESALVGERWRRVNEPAVYFLTRKAFTLLNSSFANGLCSTVRTDRVEYGKF
jgi:hypothetical protein